MLFIPVVDINQNPLMPTTSARARRWMESGKATGFFKKGVFCVRLNVAPSDDKTQPIALGVDPGSKKEGYTVKSKSHTYLNIQADTVYWVKSVIETRRMMRKLRRSRNTPYRANRKNRSRGGLPPSTKARWQWKLRLITWLRKIFPISDIIVEDIAAISKTGKPAWNKSFSMLQVGKKWFYEQIQGVRLHTQSGYQTKTQRDKYGLKKSKAKLSDKFEAHCVDSWVMAHEIVGGSNIPDNLTMLLLIPFRFHRRSLHLLQPQRGGKRRRHGGTISEGFKRGSIVKHITKGICYVGGTRSGGITLHDLKTKDRIHRDAKPEDIRFMSYSSWRTVSLQRTERVV